MFHYSCIIETDWCIEERLCIFKINLQLDETARRATERTYSNLANNNNTNNTTTLHQHTKINDPKTVTIIGSFNESNGSHCDSGSSLKESFEEKHNSNSNSSSKSFEYSGCCDAEEEVQKVDEDPYAVSTVDGLTASERRGAEQLVPLSSSSLQLLLSGLPTLPAEELGTGGMCAGTSVGMRPVCAPQHTTWMLHR